MKKILLAGSILALGFAYANDQRPPKPPQEAFDACSGKVVKDPCSVNTPNGDTIEGVCIETPKEELICKPNNMEDMKPPRN